MGAKARAPHHPAKHLIGAAERTGQPVSDLIFIDDLAENIDVAATSGWGGGVVFKNANQAARDLRALGIDIGSLDE